LTPPSLFLLKTYHFCINENCDLVRGWAKKTAKIDDCIIPANSETLRPTIGIANVKEFMSPVVGIPDVGNPVPHSYLFIPPRKEWPDFFVQ